MMQPVVAAQGSALSSLTVQAARHIHRSPRKASIASSTRLGSFSFARERAMRRFAKVSRHRIRLYRSSTLATYHRSGWAASNNIPERLVSSKWTTAICLGGILRVCSAP